MCAGIQLVGGAHARTKASNGWNFTWGATLNSGMITNGVPGGPDVVQLQGENTQERTTETGYYHQDERIWAAFFLQLDVEYRKPQRKTNDNKDSEEKRDQGRPHRQLKVIGLIECEDIGNSAIRDENPRAEHADTVINPGDPDPDDDGLRVAVLKGFDTSSQEIVRSAAPDADQATKAKTIQIDEQFYARAMEDISVDDWKEYEQYGNWIDSLEDYSQGGSP